jgi:ribokinase
MAKVTTLGTFMMDLVAYTPRRPNNGETIRGEGFAIALGGKGFNQAIAAGRAGVESAMLGNIGTDNFGDDFMKAFKEEGVSASDIERHSDIGTGVAHIAVQTSDGDNCIIITPLSNDRSTPEYIERHKETILNSDILLLQNELLQPGNLAAAKIAKENGVKVVLTPAPIKDATAFAGLCDLVVPNEGEAEALTGVSSDNPEEQAKALTKLFGCKDVVITLGPKGAFVTDGTRSEFISAPKVEAVDTIGAGDTMCANLAAKLALGADIFTAAKFGVYAATLKVTRKGSAMGSPTVAELEKFMGGK